MFLARNESSTFRTHLIYSYLFFLLRDLIFPYLARRWSSFSAAETSLRRMHCTTESTSQISETRLNTVLESDLSLLISQLPASCGLKSLCRLHQACSRPCGGNARQLYWDTVSLFINGDRVGPSLWRALARLRRAGRQLQGHLGR